MRSIIFVVGLLQTSSAWLVGEQDFLAQGRPSLVGKQGSISQERHRREEVVPIHNVGMWSVQQIKPNTNICLAQLLWSDKYRHRCRNFNDIASLAAFEVKEYTTWSSHFSLEHTIRVKEKYVTVDPVVRISEHIICNAGKLCNITSLSHRTIKWKVTSLMERESPSWISIMSKFIRNLTLQVDTPTLNYRLIGPGASYIGFKPFKFNVAAEYTATDAKSNMTISADFLISLPITTENFSLGAYGAVNICSPGGNVRLEDLENKRLSQQVKAFYCNQ
ncbi:hypothetical protein DSO57_1030750 [Entomophthora muscae]|uniref:Uncharacterized protein n=1 Tax=Entomophthora muscae TaxID=34485 RepID=A0ACC2SDL8_9FUNG|nr:hypothetical protein DSO57_1030750 [Entomophthora muscae]